MLKDYKITIRPCQNINNINNIKNDPYCPETSDIPSFHSALGMFQGLCCVNLGYNYVGIYLLMEPISRYIGLFHSVSAVAIGSTIGILCYYFFIIFNDNF